MAAILNFFSSDRSRPTITTRARVVPNGGRRGIDVCQRYLLAPSVASGVGGNPPAPAFPRRGKRERVSSDFLAAGSSRWRSANAGHAAGLRCARSSSTFLSITITNLYVDPLDPLSRSLASAPSHLPCFYPHSRQAAIGPVQVEVRSQAQVHHHGDGPGLLGCCHLAGDL